MNHELLLNIAFTQLSFFNCKQRKLLLEIFGSATSLYEEREKGKEAYPFLDTVARNVLLAPWPLKEAEKEMHFLQVHDVNALPLLHPHYPDRLRHAQDAPTVLFVKGDKQFNLPYVVSVVGTRQHTIQVNKVMEELMEGVSHLKIAIISGLALGVDGIAHEYALKNKIATWGVLAHGLSQIYPKQHRKLAIQMMDRGGLITEYLSQTAPLPFCFPQRNRIVAGMSDATIVVETDLKGGSMITANLAFDYDREVFAVPGKIHDLKSSGCLQLVKRNKAHIYFGVKDFLENMHWPQSDAFNSTQNTQLPLLLDPLPQSILNIISTNGPIHRDDISVLLNLGHAELSMHLLSLELAQRIHLQAGNRYTAL